MGNLDYEIIPATRAILWVEDAVASAGSQASVMCTMVVDFCPKCGRDLRPKEEQ